MMKYRHRQTEDTDTHTERIRSGIIKFMTFKEIK